MTSLLNLRLTCGEFVDYIFSICNSFILNHHQQTIQLLNQYAKTAARFINFEIWRNDFHQVRHLAEEGVLT